MPLNATYFTEEGYLIDHPILTTCGIFEYTNSDGSTRKELRLPEEVFARKSLESYKGKPIIITHNAGVIDKNNVGEEQIGTILGNGYKDGKDVRAEIIIHNTEELKECGLRALSLGYNLELDETPGEWHGEHYDAIQRNIEINHLALVAEARAGETARLNIDGKDKTKTGGKSMKKRRNADGEPMDPVVLEEAINAFKARKEEQDEEEAAKQEKQDASKKRLGFFRKKKMDADKPVEEVAESVEEPGKELSFEERIDSVKRRRDKRDEQDDPTDARAALGMIAEQDEDIDELLKIIEEMGAQKKNETDGEEPEVEVEEEEADFEEDEDEDEVDLEEEEEIDDEVADDEDYSEEDIEEEDEFEEDEDDEDFEEEDEEEEVEEYEESEDDEDFEDEGDDVPEDEDDDEDEIEWQEEKVVRRPDGKFKKLGKKHCDKNNCDNDLSRSKNLNLDSVDRYIAGKVDVLRTGDLLNMKGLEKMSLKEARMAIVKKMNPGIRLDGKSDKYIAGMYQAARNTARKTRRTDAQRRQIFNADGTAVRQNMTSAEIAREKMIKKMGEIK